jgi:hypothetical protein
MKVLWRALVLVSIAIPALVAQSAPENQPPVSLSFDGVDVKDVGADRVRFEVRSHVTASRKMKVKGVSFSHMRLGGVPIYLSAIEENLELEKGATVALPRIPLTVYFRDLDSLDPLVQAVRDGKTTVSGQARADLDLNLLERVAAHDQGPHAEMPIDVTIPVEVPGGNAGKTAALTALRGAQFALNLGSSALGSVHKSRKAWEQDLLAKYGPSLVIAESRYSIKQNDQQMDFYVRGMGFRITEDKVVFSGEMIEPWKYDPDVAVALQTGEASLVKENCDLLVWLNGETLDPNSARSLLRGQISVDHNSTKSDVAYMAVEKKRVKVKLLKRDSDANYAVLKFTQPEDKGTALSLAADAVRHSQNWDRVTVFRADDAGKLELISMPAHSQNGRIVLEDAIDERAFGSLLVTADGAVGMVQDEHSGMVLRNEW